MIIVVIVIAIVGIIVVVVVLFVCLGKTKPPVASSQFSSSDFSHTNRRSPKIFSLLSFSPLPFLLVPLAVLATRWGKRRRGL